MDIVDFTSEEVIRAFVDGTIEWPDPPWDKSVGSIAYYSRVCSDICDELGALSRNEFNSYGCGYASFLDAWFYRESAQFSVAAQSNEGSAFAGLFVLLNIHAPLYSLGEGQKAWHGSSASSYLPSADMVDKFQSEAVTTLSIEVERKLSERGMLRVTSAAAMQPISLDIEIETNLSDGRLRVFDALYHWMD